MIDINIRILEDENGLTERDQRVLAALGLDTASAPVTYGAKAQPLGQRLQKEAADRKASGTTKEKSAKEPEEPITTAPQGEEMDDDAKMEEAVSRATKLINDGAADKLRGILGGLGIKRVSELAGDALTQFLAETE